MSFGWQVDNFSFSADYASFYDSFFYTAGSVISKVYYPPINGVPSALKAWAYPASDVISTVVPRSPSISISMVNNAYWNVTVSNGNTDCSVYIGIH